MLRIIQAGMGGWGRDWAKSVIKKDGQVSLVACVDAEPGSLARVWLRSRGRALAFRVRAHLAELPR